MKLQHHDLPKYWAAFGKRSAEKSGLLAKLALTVARNCSRYASRNRGSLPASSCTSDNPAVDTPDDWIAVSMFAVEYGGQ